jgi:N-acetylmuramoyl-L-alanine amidase
MHFSSKGVVMKEIFSLHKIGLVALVAIAAYWGERAEAASFGQTEVNQSKVIAVAVPRANNYYSLLILEQLSPQRSCWRESGSRPTKVEPLLLNFDFTKICGRSTDSNGYSVRIAGQDKGLDYRLSVQKQDNEVVLLGIPRSGGSKLEIGRTNGFSTGFLKIALNPGWRFAKRTYQGKKLGHVYLTRDTVPTSTATAEKKPVKAASDPAPPNKPESKKTSTRKPKGFTAIRTQTTFPSTRSTVPKKSDRSKVVRKSQDSKENISYRLMVVTADAGQQDRLRSQVPGAFRTRYQGQAVMQVGIFSDKSKANDLKKQLKRQGFKVLLISDRRPVEPVSYNPPTLFSSRALLSVPSEPIPLGHSQGEVPLPPPPPTSQFALAPRYRVLVVASQDQKSKIRELVPGSFRTTYRGQSVMQIGSYPNPDEATTVMELVKDYGFEPILERTP